MSKVIAVCGKIGSGIGPYINTLKEKENALLFSNDEILKNIYIDGMDFEDYAAKATVYLRSKSIELLDKGQNIIINWGFNKEDDRKDLTDFYSLMGYKVEWHYVDSDQKNINKSIMLRNKIINTNAEKAFFSKEFIEKFNSSFEIPKEKDIDVWYKPVR